MNIDWKDFEKEKPANDGDACIISGPKRGDYANGRFQALADYCVETDSFFCEETGDEMYRPSHWTYKLPDPV